MSKTILYPTRASSVPREVHWAILTTGSHEDTYGGSDSHIEYKSFSDKAEWEAAINELEQSRVHRDYVALEVRPARIERKVTVDVK